MRRNIKTIALSATVALAAGLVVAGSALGALAGSGKPSERPLDGVPGFGLSADAVMRDEVISVWEAWVRDTRVSACMARAGFTWVPEVLYPEEAVLGVAEHSGVTPDVSADTALPADANRVAVDALPVPERDRYFQTLYGESVEVIDYVEDNSGAMPEGVSPETFARGGCYGEAQSAVGSVWDLRRDVGPELSERQAEARDALVADGHARGFQECAAGIGLQGLTSPEDVDRLLAERGLQRADEVVSTQCARAWGAVNEQALAQAAQHVRSAHQEAFEAHEGRYSGIVGQIRGDEAFKAYLAEATGRYLSLIEPGS